MKLVPCGRSLLLVGAMCGALACSSAFATLQGVTVQERAAQPDELNRVQIVREGAARDAVPGMSVVKGDVIRTADATALVTLRDGYEVIFEPGTDALIENPTIKLNVGKLIVKVIAAVRERLTINTAFASAGVEGTVFTYGVTGDQTVHIAVIEGRVTVTSQRWSGITYHAGEAGTIRAGAPPERMTRLDSASTLAIRRRIEVVESTVRRARTGAGRAVQQAPPAGTAARAAGGGPCKVPGLKDRQLKDASTALQAAGLRTGRIIRRKYGDEVTSQDPPAGRVVTCGTPVDLGVGHDIGE